MTLKNKRKARIIKAVNKDFKLIFLIPICYTLFCKFIPELLKTYIFPSETLDLASNAYSKHITPASTHHSEKYLILFISFIALLCISAWLSVYFAGTADNEKDENPSVNLSASDNQLKILFDTLFGRHQIFKNSHRNWPELQASFSLSMLSLLLIAMIQTVWIVLYLFTDYNQPLADFIVESSIKYGTSSEIAVKLPIAVLTIYFGIYAYIKKDYGDKWKYCADTYNKLMGTMDKPSISTKSLVSIDILYLDLWAKRGFCKFFKDTLIEVINIRKDWNTDKRTEYLELIENHKLSSRQTEEILEYGSQIKAI